MEVLIGILITLGSAAVLAAFKSRWLYLVVPNSFLFSKIDDGQIVALTVLNQGLMAEENVVISLLPQANWKILGVSRSVVNRRGSTIEIPRIERQEKIQIVLHVAKDFLRTEIESIESKYKRGKISADLDQAVGLPQVLVVIFLGLIFLAVPFSIGNLLGADTGKNIFEQASVEVADQGPIIQLAGYKNYMRESWAYGSLKDAVKNSRIKAEAVSVLRSGDILTLKISVRNSLKTPILVKGWYESSAGDGENKLASLNDRHFNGIAVEPNQEGLFEIKVYLPEDFKVKILEGNLDIKTVGGDGLSLEHIIEF